MPITFGQLGHTDTYNKLTSEGKKYVKNVRVLRALMLMVHLIVVAMIVTGALLVAKAQPHGALQTLGGELLGVPTILSVMGLIVYWYFSSEKSQQVLNLHEREIYLSDAARNH